MKKFVSYMSILCMLLAVTVACNDEKDLYEPPTTPDGKTEKPNTFDFSTVNEVTLNVNYNLEDNKFAVAFEVYAENPVNEVKDDEGNVIGYVMKENVTPLYGDYTNTNGEFSKKGIELPAYAETLYIVTRNPLVNPTIMTAAVSGNTVTATAPANKSVRNAKETRGTLTSNLPKNLWQKDGSDYYPKWKTLGNFDNQSGRPNYLLDRTDPTNARLVFSTKELKGLYEAIGKAVDRSKDCPEEYRQEADLELARNSEVAITMLGGNTCWNSTLGYYYYTGNKPTDLKKVHVICIFPNTQDNKWELGYSNATGLKRGDAVQLMYFPNIDNNGDMSNPTTEFPRGTKIGFVLKNNGWGCQGNNYAARSYGGSYYKGTNNFWACSTAGLSDYDRNSNNLGKQTRTAKFQYISGEDKYAIVAFEDYQNDKNFSDVTFSLKPASAFNDLPEVVQKETNASGVYAFEDLWPAKGDYDMNDVVVKYTYSNIKEGYDDESVDKYKITKESMTFKTFQNYATKNNGLAFKLDNASGYTESKMEIKTSQDADFKPATFVVEKDEKDGKQIFTLTDNVKAQMGAEYRLTLIYKNGKNVEAHQNGVAKVMPFIYRQEAEGHLEVHIPYEAPTSKTVMSYFGKEDDLSDIDKGIYYVRAGNYPFAFYLAGATETDIQPLLNRDNESKAIDKLYPRFINWATSDGAIDKDWYKQQ